MSARRRGSAGTELLSPPPTEGERPRSPSEGSPLSPASRSSSLGCEEEERVAAYGSPPGHRRAEHSEVAGGRRVSLLKDNLSPWEEWFISKEKELRARLQAKAAEEMNKQLEKMKENQEYERRKRIAEEKHKEWVQKKREEERRERKRKVSKEMAEKATRELEKMQLREKADIKYKEWLKKKRAEELEKKKKEKEKEKQREAELQEKRTRSEKIFKEWLQNARNKPQPALNGCGFPHGKSTVCLGSRQDPRPWKAEPTRKRTLNSIKFTCCKEGAHVRNPACFPAELFPFLPYVKEGQPPPLPHGHSVWYGECGLRF
ncbi:PREDICTED: coiled-coil domain-containing protein 34 [Sturnus vulgaris]|uniref:coiled-coil domain-containing protein 34 n=1 Tax=Sturnus vulgaris TaxID=9172 RepID=UPI00071A69D3|nr:PREDICTED: coiled-coil domain-containing protein 34 [Sturnus vulgaris]